jgi:hypothetical protein
VAIAASRVAGATGLQRSNLSTKSPIEYGKQNVQEAAGENDNNEPRKLNMEEKRKLEKLLLGDIDSAVARYDASTGERRNALTKQLTSKPPAEVKKLFEQHSLARRQQREAEAKLDKLGYDISYNGSLSVNTHGTLTPALAASDRLAKEGRQLLQDLKRNYVIKLFADHADTQSLFAGLAKELERLLG